MESTQPKIMLIVNILEILKRYTDERHRLSQKEILGVLEAEYGMKADRKAIRRNLMNLAASGYPIEYRESIRKTTGGEEAVYSGWYYLHDFSDAELRLLIDGLLFSKHIPNSQCNKLIHKLKGLSSKYFDAKIRHIRNMPDHSIANKQLFYTIDTLDEAIGKRKQVAFHYNELGVDKKLHPRTDEQGQAREYVINPYQIAATNGRYYLICNNDEYDQASHYRVDRITDIRVLGSRRKPMEKIMGLENGLDLPRHMAEHIYMFAGECISVRFRAAKSFAGEVLDWFGRDVVFSAVANDADDADNTDDAVEVRVRVNAEAMFYWALQYGLHVEILEPAGLRERVGAAATEMAQKYRGKSFNEW